MPLIQEQFFDIGANLTHKSFDQDLEEVLRAASESGVKRMSVTGSCLEDSISAYEIALNNPGMCISSAGIHPHNAKEYSPGLFLKLNLFLKMKK